MIIFDQAFVKSPEQLIVLWLFQEEKTETVTLIVDSPISLTRKTQSAVWEYFTKCGINEAKCSLCSKTVKTGGGTSNLRQHIRSKHREYYNSTVSICIPGQKIGQRKNCLNSIELLNSNLVDLKNIYINVYIK